MEAKGLDIRTGTTVLEFRAANILRVHAAKSAITEMEARQVIIATGAREQSRAARFIGGNRVTGVMSTGQLQQSVYLKGLKPFARPIIIGGEWVSFSALMTCRHAGIQPQAMLVEDAKIGAPWFFSVGARLRYGARVLTGASAIEIIGKHAVEAIRFMHQGRVRTTACDGVIVSGHFTGEDALFSAGPLADLRASPANFPHHTLLGNVTGPLKTAGRCVAEARQVARLIAGRLS